MSIIDEHEEQLWLATCELLLSSLSLFNIGRVNFVMVFFVQTLKNARSLTCPCEFDFFRAMQRKLLINWQA
jgi:uncharacterized membrane protein